MSPPNTVGVLSVRCSAASLMAARAHAHFVALGVIGDMAQPVMREAGQRVHAAGLARDETARQAGLGVPVVRLEPFRDFALVDRRRQPGFAELRPRERLLRRGEAGVGQNDHHHVEGLGDLARGDHRIEAVLDRARRDHHLGRVAVAAEDRRHQIALLDLGRLAGRGPAALHVDDDERNFAHHREPDRFLLERIAGAGGDGDGAFAGVGGADREGAGRDLVLGLMHDAADLLEHAAQIMRNRSRRRDRVHGADFHARREHAERQRGVAVDHDLRLGAARGRNAIFEVEILLGPVVAGVQQLDVRLNDAGVFLAESDGDLLVPVLAVEAEDIAEDAEREHVLAALGIGHDGLALALHRNFDDLVARLHELLVGLDVGRDDFRVPVLAPHAFQQNGAVGLEFAGANAAEQHLLVEGDHQVGFVAGIGDAAGADADAIAAAAGDAARRRTDFRRDDLLGPHAIAHLRGDRPEGLAAALRALARSR